MIERDADGNPVRLFLDTRAHVRNTDPATSHAAARKAEESGLVETDTALFARLVRERPGITIREMGESIGGDNRAVASYWQVRLNRRAGDVRKAGLAHSRGERDGGTCWWPGPEPQTGGQGVLFETPGRRPLQWD